MAACIILNDVHLFYGLLCNACQFFQVVQREEIHVFSQYSPRNDILDECYALRR